MVSGFSLLELLAVIALLGIMLGIVTVSLSGLRSTEISTASRTVADYINVCRSRAISKHTAIRMGIVVDSDIEGTEYRRFSSWAWNKRTKDFEQLDAWQLLPPNLTFEPGIPEYAKQSEYARKDAASVRGNFVVTEESGPPMEVDGQTVRYLEFSPTGRASTESGEKRNLILLIRDDTSESEFNGTNWAQFNIDTLTGRVRIYRP